MDGAGPVAVRLAPAAVRVAQEGLVDLIGQGIGVGRVSPVDVDLEVEGFLRAFRILELDLNVRRGPTADRIFVHVPQGNGGHDEGRSLRRDPDRPDFPVGTGIAPCPEVVTAGPALLGFRLAPARIVPVAAAPVPRRRLFVRHAEKGVLSPGQRHVADLEALPDRHGLIAPVVPLEPVRGDGQGDRTARLDLRTDHGVGEDHVDRGTAHRNSDRFGRAAQFGTESYEGVGIRGAVADLKGKTVEFLRSERGVRDGIVHAAVRVADRGEVQGLVVRHGGLVHRLDRPACGLDRPAYVLLIVVRRAGC